MSLQSTLENLRAKPEHVRTRIAFWSSFGVTALIFAFWITTFSITGNPQTRGVIATAVDKVGTPADSLIASVGGFFVDVKEMIFGAKKIKYVEVEARVGEK